MAVTLYEENLRPRLLEMIANGMTKQAACEILHLKPTTIAVWLQNDEAFARDWARARIEQAHSLADEAIRISNEELPPEDMAAVQRNRLRVDTLKWYCSKVAPKLYGDKLMQEHRHTVGVVLLPQLQQVPPPQLPPLDPRMEVPSLPSGDG